VRPATLCLALALVGAGCADATSGTDRRSFLGQPLDAGLELGIAVAPSRMGIGDTATVTVSVTNRSGIRRSLAFPSGCTLHYTVEGLDGQEVFPEGGGLVCAAVITELALAPGERREIRTRWTHRRLHYPPLSFTYQQPGRVRFRPVLMLTPERIGSAFADLEVAAAH
jgi:hypothetical protein